MGKTLKISGIISLLSGIVSFGFLIYNFFAFEYIRSKINNLEELGDTTEVLALYIGIGLLVSFFFHVSAIFTMTFRFQFSKKITVIGLVTLVAGIISFICIIGDLAALNDIGKEYRFGLSTTSEWIYLYLALIPHGVFHILMFIILYLTFSMLKNQYQPEPVLKDEIIFIVAQYIGILCGMIGLGFTFFIVLIRVSPHVLRYILPIYCPFFIIPYGLICFYWIIIKRKERVSEVYDEKQWRDVAKAGLTTLLLSIPCMGLLYVFNYQTMSGTISMIWFPYYMFLILLIFSGSTLYFNEKD